MPIELPELIGATHQDLLTEVIVAPLNEEVLDSDLFRECERFEPKTISMNDIFGTVLERSESSSSSEGAGGYVGKLVKGLRHGHGALSWCDGRRYTGQFTADRFEGEAVMEWPDGRMYTGQYRSNRKHGLGVFRWPDGRKYSGEWRDGRRHGDGVYTNGKQEQRKGCWEDDRPISWLSPPRGLPVVDPSIWGGA